MANEEDRAPDLIADYARKVASMSLQGRLSVKGRIHTLADHIGVGASESVLCKEFKELFALVK